jgi:hypothetical protein
MQQSPPDAQSLTVIEAIAQRLLLHAEYNGILLTLAPHQLYERHGDLHIGAINTAKVWREGEAPRLGSYKLAGLRNLSLTADPFEPLPGLGQDLPREGDKLILAV